ncbi:unnamed protein product [Parajaminaea phylloscopi]
MGASDATASSSATAATHAAVDSTYASLYSLLAAPASSSTHLGLLPPPALYASLSHYLSRLPKAALPEFVEALATSKSIWYAESKVHSDVEGRIHEDLSSPLTNERGQRTASLIGRAYQIHLATARASIARVELILGLSSGSTGWTSQRRLRAWVDLINSSLTQAEVNSELPSPLMLGLPIPKLAILTGIVVGLSAYSQQQKAARKGADGGVRGLDVRSALRAAEAHWAQAFADAFKMLYEIDSPPTPTVSNATARQTEDEWELEFSHNQSNGESSIEIQGARSVAAREASLVPLMLAAQAAPLVSENVLNGLVPEHLLRVVPLSVLPLFEEHNLKFSTSSSPPASPVTHVLFPCLGPLSRLLAVAGAQAALKLRAEDVEAVLLGGAPTRPDAARRFFRMSTPTSVPRNRDGAITQIVNLAAQLEARFNASGMGHDVSDVPDSGAKASSTEVWTALKSFLFLAVQLFDSVLDSLVSVLPSPITQYPPAAHDSTSEQGPSVLAVATTNIPPHILNILRTQIIGLMKVTFVTFSITRDTGGDDAKQHQVTSNEIYNRFTTYRHAFYGSLEVIKADIGASTSLVDSLQRDMDDSSLRLPLWQEMAKVTVFLDVCEQLVQSLPESLIKSRILSTCRPHLRHDDSQPYSLAPFESAHSCVLAIFDAKREVSIDLMPFYVESVLQGFHKRQISAEQMNHALVTVVACLSDVDDARSYWVVERLEKEIREGPQPTVADADGAQTDEQVNLNLQLAVIDLLPMVNLVLLRSMLDTVRKYILEAAELSRFASRHQAQVNHQELDDTSEEGGSPQERLCARTFKALNRMDNTARQEGVRWWLENRADFGV